MVQVAVAPATPRLRSRVRGLTLSWRLQSQGGHLVWITFCSGHTVSAQQQVSWQSRALNRTHQAGCSNWRQVLVLFVDTGRQGNRVKWSGSAHLNTSPTGSWAGRPLLGPATALQDTWLHVVNQNGVGITACAAAAESPSGAQHANLWRHLQRSASRRLTFPRHDVGEDYQDARPSQQRGRLPVHGVTWAAAALHRCGQALPRVKAGAYVLLEYLGY